MNDEEILEQIKAAKLRGETPNLSNYYDPRKDKAVQKARRYSEDPSTKQAAFMVLYLDPEYAQPLPVLNKMDGEQITLDTGVVKEVFPILTFNTELKARAWIRVMGVPTNRYLVARAVSDYDPTEHIQDLGAKPSLTSLVGFLRDMGFVRDTQADGDVWIHTETQFKLDHAGLSVMSWEEIAKVLEWW